MENFTAKLRNLQNKTFRIFKAAFNEKSGHINISAMMIYKVAEKIRHIVYLIVAFSIFAVMVKHYRGIAGYLFVLTAFWGIGMINKSSLQTCKLNVAKSGIIASMLLIGFSNSILILCVNITNSPYVPTIVGGISRAICSILLAPIIEEILFRGIILKNLMIMRIPSYLSILLSSIIFGAVHGNVYSAINATIIGIAFGIVYWRTNCLFPTIAMHIFNNVAVYRNLHVTDSLIGPSILFDHPYTIPIMAVLMGTGSIIKFKQFIIMTLPNHKT